MLLTDQDFGVSRPGARARRARLDHADPGHPRRPAFDLVDNAEKIRKGDLDRHRRHRLERAAVAVTRARS